MKRNVLALSILLALGIENTLAEPVYSKPEEKIEQKLQLLKTESENLRQLETLFGFLLTIVAVFIIGLIAEKIFVIFSSKEQTKKEILDDLKNELKKELPQSFKDVIYEKIEQDIKDKNKKIDSKIIIFSDITKFQQLKYRLLRKVTDIDEPSIRHLRSKFSIEEIKTFLHEVHELSKSIHNNENISEELIQILDTTYDDEIAGKAYFYIGGESDDYYKTAIDHFERVKKRYECTKNKDIHKHDDLFIYDRAYYDILRQLGNCHAGLEEYEKALVYYRNIWQKDDATYLSIGDAYQQILDYNNAIQSGYNKVIEGIDENNFKTEHQIEAYYQKANSLTGLGKYDDAIKIYEQIKQKNYYEKIAEPIWFYISFGDAYRKKSQDIKPDLQDARNIYLEGESKFKKYLTNSQKNCINFSMARTYIDEQDFRNAIPFFENVIYKDDDKNDYEGIEPGFLEIFWGHSLINTYTNHNDNRHKEGCKKIEKGLSILKNNRIDKKQKNKKIKTFREKEYHYAMGLAMSAKDRTEKNEPIKILKELIHEFPPVKNWVTAGHSSDFVTLKKEHDFIELIK